MTLARSIFPLGLDFPRSLLLFSLRDSIFFPGPSAVQMVTCIYSPAPRHSCIGPRSTDLGTRDRSTTFWTYLTSISTKNIYIISARILVALTFPLFLCIHVDFFRNSQLPSISDNPHYARLPFPPFLPRPLPNEHRDQTKYNCHTDHDSLNSKYQTDPIPSNPGRLEVSHRKASTCSPHIENGRDDGGLIGVLLQGVGCDSSVYEGVEGKYSVQTPGLRGRCAHRETFQTREIKKEKTHTTVPTMPILTIIHPIAIPIQCLPYFIVMPYVRRPQTILIRGSQTPCSRYSGRHLVWLRL